MTTPQAGAEMTREQRLIFRQNAQDLATDIAALAWGNDKSRLIGYLRDRGFEDADLTAARLDIERHVQALGRENDIIIALEDKLEAAEAELAAMGAKYEACKLQAQIHAQEARTANATIAEIYQVCTGATGEPGNWNGAEPVRAMRLDAERYRYLRSQHEDREYAVFSWDDDCAIGLQDLDDKIDAARKP